MRLYSLTDAAAVDAPEGHFEPGKDGGFDLPDTLFERLHASHVRGQRQWETAIERQQRLIATEAARRQDPATLLEVVEKLVRQAETGPSAAQSAPEPAKEAAKPPAAKEPTRRSPRASKP